MALPPFNPDDLTILDACAGYGMLSEAIEQGLFALGLRGKTVLHCERDSAAAAALVARMENSPVDQAPVCDTLRSFDTRPWRGLVDIACAGLPCQPYSLAGKRTGNTDKRSWGKKHDRRPRGPVAQFLRILRDLRPAMVFLENVPAWVVGGHFRSVGDELCRLGYTIEDAFFLAASDVGASHERERVFILAHTGLSKLRRWHDGGSVRGIQGAASGEGDQRQRARGDSRAGNGELANHTSIGLVGRSQRDGADKSSESRDRRNDERRGAELAQRASGGLGELRESSGRDGFVDGCAAELADGNRIGQRPQGHAQSRQRAADVDEICSELGDATSARHDSARGRQSLESERRPSVPRSRCDGLPIFPPGRGDESNPDHPDWRAWAAVAAMAPTAMPRVEQHVPTLADGMARADELRIGGNGVVTVAAAVAFACLLDRVISARGRDE